MKINLKNKKILLVGGDGKIGTRLLEEIVKEGAKVATTTLYQNEVQKKLMKIKLNFLTDSIEEKIKVCIDFLKEIDIFIFNSGTNKDDYFIDMKLENWENILNINLNSAFIITKKIIENMINKNNLTSKKIIFISSLMGEKGSKNQINYSVSKAGLTTFGKVLAKEVGEYGISVNIIFPGFIESELNNKNKEKKKKAIEEGVLNRLINIEELVFFVVYMCSDLFDNISGQIFKIDNRM